MFPAILSILKQTEGFMIIHVRLLVLCVKICENDISETACHHFHLSDAGSCRETRKRIHGRVYINYSRLNMSTRKSREFRKLEKTRDTMISVKLNAWFTIAHQVCNCEVNTTFSTRIYQCNRGQHINLIDLWNVFLKSSGLNL